MSTAPALQLHLPPEQDLEAEAATNAADAAELEQVKEAAAAVEEGDEVEGEEAVEEGEEPTETTEATEAAADDDLGEEPTELHEEGEPVESEAPGPQLAATPNAVPSSPSPPPSTPATIPPALQAYRQRRDWELRREEARDRYEGAMFEFRKLEAATKAAKERWKDAEDQLFEILHERPDEDYDGEYVIERQASTESLPAKSPEAVAVVEELTAPPPLAPAAPVDPDVWRSVSIMALLLPTPITSKLIEEGYNTLGKIEDLRANTFAGGLKSIKGIGQKKADLIEEKILDWLSKNRDKAVLDAARVEAATEPAKDQPTEQPAEQPSSQPTSALAAVADPNHVPTASGPLTSDAAGNVLNDGDPNWYADIEARSQQIYFRTGDLSGVSPDDCLSQQLEDSRYWEGGYEAYNNSVELIECPIAPKDAAERDDWLRGWMSAKLTNEEGWEGPGTEQ